MKSIDTISSRHCEGNWRCTVGMHFIKCYEYKLSGSSWQLNANSNICSERKLEAM